MDECIIEPFDRASHDRSGFSCGNAPLDNFLRTLVSQYEKKRLGRTYVGVRPGSKVVIGYFTLAAGSIPPESFPSSAKKFPAHPVPVVLLARLAVDSREQGRGIGARLLASAMGRCLQLGRSVGVHSLIVDAIDDSARSFYERFGFDPLLDGPFHLYLPLASIESGLLPPVPPSS